SRTVIFGTSAQSDSALKSLVARGNSDVVPALVLALRYRRDDAAILEAVAELTGEVLGGWKETMLWQEAHPEVIPHISYRDLKLDVFRRIDPQFLRFLGGDRAKRANLKIRLEEITWGGVPVDGIPSLDDPELIPAAGASYLLNDDLVFGVEINGDVRAYPLRIMGWHEMFNDTIGGVPVALAYCTLCGSGILFETKVSGRAKPFVFGSSGLLYRSNKLMFDRQTDSLWNQFTGKPISGPLRDSGIELKIRPVVITSWANWKARHSDTKVLSLNTGHRRDYGSGVVYREYFASPELMFPTIVRDEKLLKRKDYVFGIRAVGAAKAWPIEAFSGRAVINDAIGSRNIVLIGDAMTRSVRAYERQGFTFSQSEGLDQVAGPSGIWTITESALIGPSGVRLARVPGHISYWFAWDGYLGLESDLYKGGTRH
ncbi:MAG: DUF3179 domain-containing protein, partial [Hyphomicrobiaceae bacterium]